MRNMWSCPDTQSEETQSLTPSVSPPLSISLPPFLPFFLSRTHTHTHALSRSTLGCFLPRCFSKEKNTRHHFAAFSSSECLRLRKSRHFSPRLYLKHPPTHISVTNDPLSAGEGGGTGTYQPGCETHSRASPALCVLGLKLLGSGWMWTQPQRRPGHAILW